MRTGGKGREVGKVVSFGLHPLQPQQTPATTRPHTRPPLLAQTGLVQPLWSPGSALTPQLFTQRKSLFASEAPVHGGSASGSPAGGAPPSATDDSIKVVLRIRPPTGKETAEAACLQHTGVDTLTLLTNPEPTFYTLDHVAGGSQAQAHMHKVVGRPIVDNVLAGFNSTIIAYGQTGSGKTYTMLGELPEEGVEELPGGAGLMPRIFAHLFERISEIDRACRAGREAAFTVSCSLLEVYQEQVTDLMATSARVTLREDKSEGVFIEGLSWHPVACAGDVLRLLTKGAAYRHTATTKMNDTSSRSHMVMTCSLEMRIVEEGAGVVRRRSRLSLVDLAGSERQKAADTQGDRLKEAQAINKSLFTLGQVINKLTEGSAHVPYRESKLTQLLRESLGGNSRTVIIPTVAPCASCFFETQSTLKFACRAKQIQNRAVVNEDVSQSAVEMAAELQRLRREVAMLRGLANSSSGGSDGSTELRQALVVNEQLEDSNKHLQQQLGRLRQERDSYEAASKAAHAQLQILEQAESGATERMQDLVAEVERLQQAYTDCQTKLEQQRGQLGGMAAETRQRALDQRLAAAALSQQSAALSKAEQELEVARAQLAALQACEGAKENKLRSSREMAATVASLEATYCTVQMQMKRLMDRNDALVAERDGLKAKVQDYEVRAANAATVIASSQAQVEALRGERAALQDEAARLTGALAEGKAQLQALAKRNGELSLEIDNRRSFDNGIQHLRQELAEAKQDADALQCSKAAVAERVVLLEMQLQEQSVEGKQTAAAAAVQIDKLSVLLRDAKEASLAHEASAAYQRGHREQLEKEHTRLMREKQQLEQRHKELVDNLRRNREDKSSARESQLAELDEAWSQLDVLENTVGELRRAKVQQTAEQAEDVGLRQELDQARQQHSDAVERLALAKSERDALEKQVEALHSRGAADEAALSGQQALVRELRDQVKEAAAEMEQLRDRIGESQARLQADHEQQARQGEELEAALNSITHKDALLDQLTSQAEELSRRLQEVQSSAQGSSAEAAQLQEILHVKSDRLEALEAEVAVGQERLVELERVQEASRAASEGGQAVVITLREQVVTLEAELSQAQSELYAKDGTIAGLEAALAELQTQLQHHTEQAQEEGAEAAAELRSIEQQLERAQQQLADAQQGLAVRTQQLQAHEAAVAAQAEQVSNAQRASGAQAAQHAERMAQVQAELAASKKRADECSAAAKAGAVRADGLEAQVARLTKQLAAAKEKTVQYDSAALDLEKQLSAAEAALASKGRELEAAAAALTALEEEAVVLRQQLAHKGTELEAKEWRIESLQGALADLEQEMAGKAAEAEASTARTAMLTKQLDEREAELEAMLADVKQQAAASRDVLGAKAAEAASLQQQLAASRQEVTEMLDTQAQLQAAQEASQGQLAAQLQAAEAEAASKQEQVEAAEAKLAAAEAGAAATAALLAKLQAGATAAEEQAVAAKRAMKQSQADTAGLIQEHLATLRSVQEEVAALKAEADKAQREKQVLRESLCQATADAVEQMAAHQEFRAERDEAVGILRAQVAQLQALGASRQHELQGTISRLEDLQKQASNTKAQAVAAEQALATATAERDRLASALAQKDAELVAVQAERDGLLADQQQLMQAVAEQAAQASEDAAHGSGVTPAVAIAASPAPPSLDVIRMLRDQKDALKAQHEATVADMKELMSREAQLLRQQLQRLTRERDNAVAEHSFAREEARVAAANGERALAAARAAQSQLQIERDAIMSSLSELQAAFNTVEAKRGAEMRRLKTAVEVEQREAAELRAQLEQYAIELRHLNTAAAAGQAAPPPAAVAAPAAAPMVEPQGRGSHAGQARVQQQQQRNADIDGDVVLQRSLASSQGQPMPLQSLRLVARQNVAAGMAAAEPPKQGGWGTGYERAFLEGGTSPNGSVASQHGGGSGFLSSRWLVGQDENSRGHPATQRARLPSVARYSRFDGEGPSN